VTQLIQDRIKDVLAPLLQLKLSLSRSMLDVRAFHFGAVRRFGQALSGEYVLHLNCPWRIESAGRIITGRHDHFARADDNQDPSWEVGTPWGTYQEQALRQLLGGYDPENEACVNVTELLVVERVDADEVGGFSISMTGGYALVVFPAGTRNEHWRLLPPTKGEHFVVEGREAHWA
jgi:hypothetical protein